MPKGDVVVPRWAVYSVAAVAVAALLAAGVFGIMALRKPVEPRATEPAQAPTTSTPATSAVEATAAQAPVTTVTAPPTTKPETQGVKVTRETGESYCLVSKVIEEDGRDYVALDYIQLGTVDHGSEDYDVINENTKLRTYELASDSWLGAYWLCVDLYGQSVADKFDFEGGPGGRGYPLKRTDFKRIVRDGQGNEHSYWYVQVKDGKVRSLVQTYQD